MEHISKLHLATFENETHKYVKYYQNSRKVQDNGSVHLFHDQEKNS